jgi:hypothetical protein
MESEPKHNELIPRTPLDPEKLEQARQDHKRISAKVIQEKQKELQDSEKKRQIVIAKLGKSKEGQIIEEVFAKRDKIGRTPPIKLMDFTRSVQV